MDTRGICYIFGAGEHFGPPPAAGEGDLVIAADGGYRYLEAYGVQPGLLVGDFDSLDCPPEGVETMTLPVVKDDTDMAAALETGWARGYRAFHIYGGTGGRLDHTLANIQCLADLARRGGRGWLHGGQAVVTAIHNGAVDFPPVAEGTLSVFAHGETAEGVWECGLQYSLENATLSCTRPLGVSNAFTGRAGRVRVERGTLILVYPDDVEELAGE